MSSASLENDLQTRFRVCLLFWVRNIFRLSTLEFSARETQFIWSQFSFTFTNFCSATGESDGYHCFFFSALEIFWALWNAAEVIA